ncbi:retrovirus-related pol polyprotein from transposon TNT 1-94 [Tanacetum coccineum]
MLSPNPNSYYNCRASFVNPMYLKKAQSEKPCLYQVTFDKDDLANIFAPNSDETLILEEESKSKLNKDKVKPYDYTSQNSLYELFTPQTHKSLDQMDIVISKLKKLIEKSKRNFVETKFDKPHVARQTNAIKVPKPSVLGKPTPFSDSLEKRDFSKPRNDQFTPILGYEDLVQGNITIKRVYYVEGLNNNLFFDGQFCDADMEVAFIKPTCYIRDLQGNDLLLGTRQTDLYTIALQESSSPTPICFLAKASLTQAWLWHRRVSHLNFDTINLLSKNDIILTVTRSKKRLDLLHMDLCGHMLIKTINGKKCILVIVDDYSRYTRTLFLRSKDETLEVLKDFLKMIQRKLQAQVITVRIDRGTEFLNKTLPTYFKEEGIEQQTSTTRTLEHNGVVKRRDRTLVEASRTMLSAYKLPLFFWVEAIAVRNTEKCLLHGHLSSINSLGISLCN